MSCEYEWVEVSNPNLSCSFYANQITGECRWSKPIIESSIFPNNPEGDWWELWDEKNHLPYYYHTRANTSNWVRPTNTNIISLVKIRFSQEFSKQMSLLIKKPSIQHTTMKRNSRSLDLSEITTEPANNLIKRQHQRSTSDSIAKDIIDKVPEDRKQSICSTKEPVVSRGSYLPLFKTGPFKNLVNRSSSPTSYYSVAISSPTNNPDAAIAMNPLYQKSPPSTPSATLRKPTLPAGLQQEINRFAIDGFAQKFFATHKRGLFRKRVPVNEMLKWTKESLRQPLIMMNRDLYKDALKCFKWIQMIMGDRSRSRHANEIEDIQSVLTCGITKGQMRDEIYVQVCKQLHDNPQSSSIYKGWEFMVLPSKIFTEKNSANPPSGTIQPNTSISGRHANPQQYRSFSGDSPRQPTVSYADITSGKPRTKSVPKNEKSLMTTDSIPLNFQTGTFTHSVFYSVPKHLSYLQSALHSSLRQRFPQDVGLGLSIKVRANDIMIELALASADDCNNALTTPVVLDTHIFSAFPAHSSVNTLHKIALTEIIPATREILKNRLLSTFSRFGIVKDIVTYHDDMTGEWFTGNGHVYLEVPQEINKTFESLTHRISLNGSDSSVLATWARMPDFCRYCKALGHSKDSCDKRPADSRTCYVCHQKGHISYQCNRTQDREPQPHKRPRNREPTSIITSRRIATPKSTKGSKTSTKIDLTFGPSSWPSALATLSSDDIASPDVVSQISTAHPPDDLSQTAVKEILIQNSPCAETATVSASSPNLEHGLVSSPTTATAGTSVSKFATHISTSAPSDLSTKSTDAEMTDLQDIDFNKFPESSQEETQRSSSQFEMEA